MPYKVELMICTTDHVWYTDYIEVNGIDDSPGDEAIATLTENYEKNKRKTDPEIVYVGVYHIDNLDDLEEDLDYNYNADKKDYDNIVKEIKKDENNELKKLDAQNIAEQKQNINNILGINQNGNK